MLLKEIGIKGFKSFANKIKLNITPGITVIVGPNGCGKSNIIDAVRWLLGEQSMRSLRGTKITDMIFSGNNENKMRNYAQVYMLFDNASRKVPIDSEEIEVKRIIYRSGEIENYINNVSCKLRDIQDLFTSLGLGKNSYSIIAQGRVDYVINARPFERRALFEEASDVGIYRSKKENVLKKLELVSNNLLRVNDILHEVENTLEYYKIKSDNLEAYKKYKDYILKLEYYLLYHQHLSLQRLIEKNNKKIAYYKEKSLKINENIICNKNEISLNEQRREELEFQLQQISDSHHKNEIEKNNFANQLTVLNQQKKDLLTQIINNQEDSKRSFIQFEEISNNLSSIEIEIRNNLKDIENSKDNLKIDKYLLDKYLSIKDSFEGKLSYVASLSKNIQPYFSEYREAKIKKESEWRTCNHFISETEKEIDGISRKIINGEALFKNINTEISVLEKKIEELSLDESKINDEINRMKSSLQEKVETIQNISNDLKFKNKEIELLKDLLNTTENYNNLFYGSTNKAEDSEGFVEFVDLKPLNNIIPEYLKQIYNIIFDKNIKFVHLTHSEKIFSFKQLNRFIKQERIKIIADNFITKTNHKKDELKRIIDFNNKNIIGFADQLFSFPKEYKMLSDAILRHILIVKDMITALDIAYMTRGKIVLISLDGMIIDEQGIISIGFNKNGKYEFGNRSFKDRIAELEKDINIISTDMKTNKNILEKEKNEYNKLVSNSKNTDIYLKNSVLKINNKRDQLARIMNDIAQSQKVLETLNSKKKEASQNLNNLEKTINLLNDKMKNIDSCLKYISRYQNIILRYYDSANKLAIMLSRNIDNYQMKASLYKEKEDLLKKRKNEILNFTKNYHAEKIRKEEQLNQYQSNMTQLTNLEIGLKEKLNCTLRKQVEFNEIMGSVKNSIKELDNILKNFRNKLYDEQEYLDDNKNKLHKYEMIYTQNKEKYNHLLNTLSTQYNITIDEILNYKNFSTSQTDALSLISKYKEQIQQMGQINYNALEEYDEQFKKFKNLQDKKNEIVESKEKLITLISEIDRIAEEHFFKTFKEVEVNFKEIFNKLFNGGEASLELTNSKNLFDTGIEVLVQPPGKQIQNISLLSMGEKALTAIALLFALWKANPTPFCFFDEIDSSLDESNALRLSSFIRNEDFRDSQIIIITHQKRVMEAADALYGITMDGFGTSKLMSVKMLNTEGE